MAKKPGFVSWKEYFSSSSEERSSYGFTIYGPGGEPEGKAGYDYIGQQIYEQEMYKEGDLEDKAQLYDIENWIKNNPDLTREQADEVIRSMLDSMAFEERAWRLTSIGQVAKLKGVKAIQKREPIIRGGKSGASIDLSPLEDFLSNVGELALVGQEDTRKLAELIYDDVAISSARSVLADALEDYFLSHQDEIMAGENILNLARKLLSYSLTMLNNVSGNINSIIEAIGKNEILSKSRAFKFFRDITDSQFKEIVLFISGMIVKIESNLNSTIELLSKRDFKNIVGLISMLDEIYMVDLEFLTNKLQTIRDNISSMDLVEDPVLSRIVESMGQTLNVSSEIDVLEHLNNFYINDCKNMIMDAYPRYESFERFEFIDEFKNRAGKIDVFDTKIEEHKYRMKYIFSLSDDITRSLSRIGVSQDLIFNIRSIISNEMFGRNDIYESVFNHFRNSIIMKVEGIE